MSNIFNRLWVVALILTVVSFVGGVAIGFVLFHR